ncbi:MAG TPA: FAD-dependent oxidoreductase [Patescibacteria group bacterium]|nr:FAD-dependent oxidoreductase [Patescibacteria group bacterium]
MAPSTAEVVICGAGIAGIATAYHLTRHGVTDIVLVDERPPLSLTSDKSTECYRNLWPGPGDAMVAAMNRSIDLLEELARDSGNVFRMNRRGYLFASADPARIPRFIRSAQEAADVGAGSARVHASGSSDYRPSPADGFEDQPVGVDVITDRTLIRRHFPYLADDTVSLFHARRCGWLSGQQLGMHMLERARDKGVRLVQGSVERIDTTGGRVRAVTISGTTLATSRVVNAAGPFVGRVGRMLGVELPVYCEQHAKIAFADTLGAMPREAPLLIWTDPARVAWSDEEREALAASRPDLLEEIPTGAHGRPEGGGDSPIVLLLWTYHLEPVEPAFPMTFDPAYAEFVIRGMARMVPAFARYADRLPRAVVDGGYYTRTRENRFLAGPLPVDGAYVCGALGGYGLMASNVAGELVAAHMTGRTLPPYAPAFTLARYDDPAYRALLEHWGDSGQL